MQKYCSNMIELTKMLSAYSGKYYLYATGWYDACEEAVLKNKYSEFVDNDLLGAFPDLAIFTADENKGYNASFSDLLKVIFDEGIVVEFDDKDSLMKAYFNIVGDDGNSAQFTACSNSYSGDMRVYAVTIYDGISHHENT